MPAHSLSLFVLLKNFLPSIWPFQEEKFWFIKLFLPNHGHVEDKYTLSQGISEDGGSLPKAPGRVSSSWEVPEVSSSFVPYHQPLLTVARVD